MCTLRDYLPGQPTRESASRTRTFPSSLEAAWRYLSARDLNSSIQMGRDELDHGWQAPRGYFQPPVSGAPVVAASVSRSPIIRLVTLLFARVQLQSRSFSMY